MEKWFKVQKTERPDCIAITYASPKHFGITIESRKKQIPHSNRAGTWEHTTYFVIWKDGSETEFQSLKEAKLAVEGAEE